MDGDLVGVMDGMHEEVGDGDGLVDGVTLRFTVGWKLGSFVVGTRVGGLGKSEEGTLVGLQEG